ncbi:MAG TPA: GLUG motif-containing protein, partial [Sedimentisphaerales bacterium]|nr:GLUG motif-containing protein [Sedimentisphaerales bacterium]
MAESGCVRKLGCVVLAILILCCSRALCGTYGGGTGTEADPYIISTDAHLQELSANSGDWGQCFKLTADITAALYTPVTLFTGQFDGNHHTISDFSYTSETAHYRGFFCRVEGHGAVVKNLTLIAPNVNVPTRQYVGAIAGRLRYGVISGCSVIGGSVRGHSITGGIVGHNFTGSVIDCFSSASVVSGMRTGGIVGSNDENSYITGCVNQGSVTASSDFGGGIAGENLGYLTACYSSGNVTGINYVGGLIGTNGTSGRVAPVVRCFSESPTSGTSWVGGLIGRNASGPVSDSFAAGAVAPVNAPAAGLIARNESTGTVARCYSRGAVTKMGSNFGGLIGQNLATASAIAASFWDTQTSGQTTSAGGTGRT